MRSATELAPGVEDRFWSKVEKTETCWLWQGAMSSNGYGNFRSNRKYWKAHQVAVLLTAGCIPDGLEIDHTCQVRRCVRPDHLELVTHEVNLKRRPWWQAELARLGRSA